MKVVGLAITSIKHSLFFYKKNINENCFLGIKVTILHMYLLTLTKSDKI